MATFFLTPRKFTASSIMRAWYAAMFSATTTSVARVVAAVCAATRLPVMMVAAIRTMVAMAVTVPTMDVTATTLLLSHVHAISMAVIARSLRMSTALPSHLRAFMGPQRLLLRGQPFPPRSASHSSLMQNPGTHIPSADKASSTPYLRLHVGEDVGATIIASCTSSLPFEERHGRATSASAAICALAPHAVRRSQSTAAGAFGARMLRGAGRHVT